MRRRVLTYAAFALAATATAGGLALNRILDRPGATAMDMVPSNALGVVALDLVPAPDQILAFKSIDDMIASSKEPMAKTAKTALLGSLLHEVADTPELEVVGQQVDRSIAIAMLPKREKSSEPTDGEGVVLMPVKDASVIANFLRSKGKTVEVEGVALTSIHTKSHGDVFFSLQGNVLIGASTNWVVADVTKTAMGQTTSIVKDAAFATARGKALPSANLLVFVNPKIVKGEDWAVASMTIRDTGIEVGVSGQTDDPEISKAGNMAPLGPELLAALPKGAYGFFGFAQPGPTVALAGDMLDEPAKDMKKEMELDLKSEVLPALGGNVAVGFYPSFGPDAGVDLLVSIDDANGADPASLAAKLEKIVDDKAKEDKDQHGDWKVQSRTADGITISHLSDEPEKAIQEGITGMEKSFFRPLTMSRGKTVAWATVGHSVLLATSESLLTRAVQQRRSPVAALGLSTDSAMGARPVSAADGQFALAISMKRLVEGIRNTVDPSHMSPEAASYYRKTLSLYDNTTEPLAIRAKMSGDGRYSGYVSIPFDWTKLPGMLK